VTGFTSALVTASAPFVAARERMLETLARVRDLEQRTRDRSAAAGPRFARRGQLLPRERLALLLDPGAPFLEFSTLAGYRLDDPDPDKSVPGGGVVAGIGQVSGTRCVVAVNDSGIDAGALQPRGLDKQLRAQEIALQNRLPYVQLVESAGANLLNYRVEEFVHGGNLFRNLARLSAAELPVVTVVHGSSTAGGAYQTGLSDYIVMVRGRSRAFLAGHGARSFARLPRGAATAARRDRRGRHRRGARRRRDAHHRVRPRPLPRRGRPRRHPHGARTGRHSRLRRHATDHGRAAARRAATAPRRGGAARHHAGGPAPTGRHA